MGCCSVKVVRFGDVETFYTRIEPYLLRHEAEHNLVFGLLSYIRHDPAKFPGAIMALVEDAGAIQFVALQTDPAHNLILSEARSADAVTTLANDLAASGVSLHGAQGKPDEIGLFIEAWTRLKGCSSRLNTPMRSFKLEKVNVVTGVSGHLRRAVAADHDLLVEWEYAFMREAFPDDNHDIAAAAQGIDATLAADAAVRGIFMWEDGGAVSYAAYKGPTPHGIRIGPVYTPPDKRGHGYASGCVAGMSQSLLDAGYQFCFLFTDLRNPTSNHIYQVIGYEPICDFTEYRFSTD